MTNIRAGDVVVCVDMRPLTNQPEHMAGLRLIALGKFYRVESVVMPIADDVCLVLEGLDCRVVYAGWSHGGFRAWRFRKVQAPRTELSKRIKRCRPVKTPEPASADTRRMAETGTGSGRSPSGAVPAQQGDAHA